jgi:glycerate 2-kinase
MKVLIAPDKFKGTLSAAEAASAMADGVLRVYPDAHVQLLPMADGGEGTLEAALAAGAVEHSDRVVGPLDREVTASWAMFERPDRKTAVIETARASGLLLTEPSVQSALAAHSYGSGQLIEAALNAGATEIVLGVGGSAMTDGGSGALRALGVSIYNDGGAEVLLGGAALATAELLDASGLDPRLAETVIRIAADVANPLYGADGAAHVFGEQKGADAVSRRLLDEALQRWSQLLLQATGRDVNVAGAGAAGGFPSGFLALAGARVERGFEVVADLVGLDAALADADLVLTGEGSLDRQSEFGKVPLGVAGRAHARGIPAVVVAGQITLAPDKLAEYGVHAAASLVEAARSEEQAMAHAARYVTLATQHALEGA